MAARRFTDAQCEQMAERRESGQSYARIAHAFGCSASNVYWICLKLGADAPNAKPSPSQARGPMVVMRGEHAVRRFTADEDARMLALEAEGKGESEIGKLLGRRANSIRGRLMTLARREARTEAA